MIINRKGILKLSKNFDAYEAVKSDTAKKFGYKEQYELDDDQIETLRTTVFNIAQKARDFIKKKVFISSGYRCLRVNMKQAGASANSTHKKCKAIDIKMTSRKDLKIVYEYIRDNLKYTELIWYYDTDNLPRWIHITYDPENLAMILKVCEKLPNNKYNYKVIDKNYIKAV